MVCRSAATCLHPALELLFHAVFLYNHSALNVLMHITPRANTFTLTSTHLQRLLVARAFAVDEIVGFNQRLLQLQPLLLEILQREQLFFVAAGVG